MACSLEDFLARLDRVRTTRHGHEARCPAHEDRKASLTIGVGEDGRLLVRCFAGCPAEAIVGAVGLTLADLFPARGLAHAPRPKGATVDRVYPYRDETGRLLYEVVRFVPKDFRQRRPLGSAGRYVWNLTGVRKVVYHLDQIARRRPVALFVPEGERDVETLEAHGLPATTNPGGAGKWTPEYTAQLKACGVQRVAILPDADEPGFKHAAQVAATCERAGLVPRVVPLDGLGAHGDVTDYLANGGTAADLLALTKATAAWRPTDPLGLVNAEALMKEPDTAVDFLVEDRLACGSVALIVAKPKEGKSTVARALGFAVATGGEWLGSRCRPGHVVYLAFEDKRSEVKRHFRLLGLEGHESIQFLFGSGPADLLEQLAGLLARERVDLLIVDTVQRLLKLKDTNDYAEVTAACDPLIHLARTHGTCIVLIHHAGKGDHTGVDTVMGSTAWSGSVDNIFVLKRTPAYRYLSTIQRIGPDLGETVVKLDEETGAVRLAGSRYLVDVATLEQELVAELESAETPLSRAALLAAVKGRRAHKLLALKNLLANGRLERTGKGTKTAPFSYVVVPRWYPSNGYHHPESASERQDGGIWVPLKGGEPGTTTTTTARSLSTNSDRTGTAGVRARVEGTASIGHADDVTTDEPEPSDG